jgi:hypothetical protein
MIYVRSFYTSDTNATKDYAISIATIHHLATAERRRHAVKVIGVSIMFRTYMMTSSIDNPSLPLADSRTSTHIRLGNKTRRNVEAINADNGGGGTRWAGAGRICALDAQ